MRFQRTALLATSVAAAAACSAHLREKQQFAGEMTSEQAGCPAQKATLVIQEGKAIFSPGDGTWLLTGAAADNHVTAAQSRPSFDHKIYATTLDAKLTEATTTGIYVTPSCRYDVKLNRF